MIAAISTPPGKGGVAVIRISGIGAAEIADRVFFPASGKPLSSLPLRTQVWGRIVYRGEAIDDSMATLFRAPRSYTGEDTVEISCHGGMLVTRTVLEAVLSAGARLADRGEFTRRAFLNGKLTLTEAEAIGDLLDAASMEQIRLTTAQSRSLLSEKIAELRKSFTDVLSSLFARIDYPDEDLGDYTDEEMLTELRKTQANVERLLATYRTGRAITEGIRATIVGRPNVGKSSLYNLLVGEDAAIVTPTAGTTRDCLERSVPLGRVMLRLVDTAGIRGAEDADPIERIGIERARAQMERAELLIAMFDLSRPFSEEDESLLSDLKSHTGAKVAVLNKTDLDAGAFDAHRLDDVGFDAILRISTEKSGEDTVAALTDLVERLCTDEKITVGTDAILATARQNAALTAAAGYLREAIAAVECGIASDAAASEIERALGAISEIDGRAVSEEVVGAIFDRFCVGK